MLFSFPDFFYDFTFRNKKGCFVWSFNNQIIKNSPVKNKKNDLSRVLYC